MTGRTRKFALVGIEFLVPILLITAWWFLSANSTDPYFPPLEDIWHNFKTTYLNDLSDVWYSVSHFVIGTTIGVILGYCFGIAIGLSARLRRNLAPLNEFFRAIPLVALIPVALVMFGPGLTLEVVLIVKACIFVVMLNTADGVRGVDPVLIESAQAYGLKGRQIIRKVIIPSSMPQTLVGVQIAVGIGIAVMVVANMFGNGNGLGARVVLAQTVFDIKGSWAGILMIAIIGIVITTIYTMIHSYLLRWHRGWRASAET